MSSEANHGKSALSSGFVLDEGFEEDDEEVLAFEASRAERKQGFATDAGLGTTAFAAPVSDASPVVESRSIDAPAASDALVFENLPKSTTRSDIEALVGGDVEISSIKVHRFHDKTMLAMIQFCEEVDAADVFQRHTARVDEQESNISVTYAPSDWDTLLKVHAKANVAPKTSAVSSSEATGIAHSRSAVMSNGIPVNFAEAIPATDELKASFWDAVTQAQHAAEALDHRARAAGSDIDSKYHVAEQLADAQRKSRALLAETDEKFKLSDGLRSAVEAGKAGAGEITSVATSVDQSYNVSSRINTATSKLGQAGSIAAREIDENLHLSDRARMAANIALENEQIGPAVKHTVSQLESFWQSFSLGSGADAGAVRKKERPPQGIEQDSMPGMMPEKVEMSSILDDGEAAGDDDTRHPAQL